MPLTLNPREYFTIVRGLADHTDATTYYVRAVIRNSRTDEVIATVDLEDSGDGYRFTKIWQVPADTSGLGMFIDIVTSVYSDALYTTKATKYYDEYDTYLIQERMNPNLGYGGGSDVDYKRIEKMIKEAISGIPKPETVEYPSLDLSDVLEAISSVREAVSSIRMPEMEKVDLSMVLSKLDTAIQSASDKEMTNEHRQYFDTMKEEMTGFFDRHGNESLKGELTDLISKIDSAISKIKDFFTTDIEEVKNGIADIKKEFEGINVVVMNKKADVK